MIIEKMTRDELVRHWTSGYNYWRAKLAGEHAEMYPDNPCLGFYRKGIRAQKASGQWHRTGWEPVAIFLNGDVITARIGDQDVNGPDLLKLWEYCGGNAISEEWYRAVAERGEPWPDAHDPKMNKATNKIETMELEDGPVDEESPEAKLAREITETKAGVSQYDKIESDEQAGRALSLKNTITSLAGDLDKHREALVRPHIDAQREVNDRLNPIIKAAKADGASLLRSIGVWEDTKRAAQRAAEEAQRRRDEEERKAREWQEATPPGSVPEPLPPSAPPIKSNAPPPAAQVAAAVGRKASVKLARFVTDIDVDKAFAQFRNEPGVRAVLIALAQKAVDAGLSVNGATVEERSIVR